MNAKIFLIPLVVVVALIISFEWILVPAYRKKVSMEKKLQEKREINEQLSGEIMAFQREIHDLEHNPAATEKVAREKFNYCREGEIIYVYSD